MTQTRRNPEYRRAFGRRLQILVEGNLKVSWRQLASLMGYETDSALRQARDGRSLLSAEKLAALAALKLDTVEGSVSLDWLLTGGGTPIRPWSEEDVTPGSVAARVQRAPTDVQQTIAAYLDVRCAATPSDNKIHG